MKNKLFLFGFILLSLIVLSCNNNDFPPGPSPLSSWSNYGTFKVNVNGKKYFDTTNVIFNRFSNTIRISSTKFNVGNVVVLINGIATGDYYCGPLISTSVITFTDKNGKEYNSVNSGGSGVVHVEKIDTVNMKISGSFEGVLSDEHGDIIQFSNGKFEAPQIVELPGGDGCPNVVNSCSFTLFSKVFNCKSAAHRKGNRILITNYYDADKILLLEMPVGKPGTYTLQTFGDFNARYVLGYYNYNKPSVVKTGAITILSHDYLNNIITGTFDLTLTVDGQDYHFNNGEFSVVY